MGGLKISICFWYLDPLVVKDVINTLGEGGIDVVDYQCHENSDLSARLRENPPDLIIADFDSPVDLREVVEKEMEAYYTQVPLIFLVGDVNKFREVGKFKAEVWDYIFKDRLFKLIPSVFSSQRYSKLFKQAGKAESALSESRDRYISIFNSVDDAIILFDAQTRKIAECNPRLLELFELTEKDIKNVKLGDLNAEDEGYTVERAREFIPKLSEGEPHTFEWRNISKKGRKFWTLNSISKVTFDGTPYILLVTRDIDDRKQMEKSLQESQEHFRALAENSPDVIMRFDHDHKHVYVNEAVVTQTGLKVEDFLGKSHADMGVFPDDLVELWETSLKKIFKTGQDDTIIFEIPLGERIAAFEWRLYPEKNSQGSVESVIGVARDVTETKVSENALKKSEERLNLALQGTNLGLWDWNLLNNQVYLSPIWFSMLGYRFDELPQELDTWTSLQHPEDAKRSVSHVMRVIKNRDTSFDIEFRMRHKNGSYVWIRSMGKAVGIDKDGNTIRLTGIHENISLRKRDEQVRQVLIDISNAVSTTQSLEELYSKIRESLGRVVDTKNCFLALYNETADTLTLPFMEDEKDSFTEFPARKTLTSYVIRTGEPQLVDIKREKELTREGEIEPVGAPCVSWLGVPLKHDEKTIGVFAVQSYSQEVVYTKSDAALLEFASDQIALAIERRRDQDNLRITQEKQRRVFESSPDPMIVVDPSAMILDFNSAFVEAFNVDPELVYGEKIFRFIHRDDWRKAIKAFNETWKSGYLKNMEYQIVRPDGVTFDGEASSGAIYNSNGKPESMVLILKNITERKDAERKLLESKYKAEESDRLKTAFLSNMSHEIRTPMNAIVGFSDLLSDDGLTQEDRKDFIAQINQGADDLMRLIDDIIDIAKIEAGQVNVHIAECFLLDLFKELHLMFLQNIKRSGKDDVTLTLKWDWPVSELAIYTDPFRLKQILVNLLGNAVKFTESGEIVLGIEEHPEGIKFYVKDSGIGIREEKQKVIFDRFMQGHETKTKLYGGTGLGLAISKNLTEILGGEIGLESVSGEGATFWFILPRNEVPLKYEAALRAPVSDIKSWSGKKLLIAEDDHSNYYFLFEALKDTGVEIHWARDGEETLTLFKEIPDLNLVLMDINMPVINGYECTRLIKAEKPDLPIIAQTAYAMSGEREISKDAGCDDYLSKPIKVKELLEAIGRLI